MGFERKTTVISTLSALALGALIGATVALLMAPKSGDEVRQTIKDRSSDLKDRAMDKASDTRERASNKMEDIRSSAREHIDDLTNRGQESFENARERVHDDVQRMSGTV